MTSASAQRLLVPRILWAALLGSQAIYLVLVGAPLVELPAGPGDLATLASLATAAGMCAVTSFVLPRIIGRAVVAQQTFEMHDVPDPSALVGFRGPAPTLRAFADPDAVRAAAYRIGFAPFIISLALSEAVSLMGLVAAMLGQPPERWVGFFVVGAALTAMRFPTERTFYAPIERATGVALAG